MLLTTGCGNPEHDGSEPSTVLDDGVAEESSMPATERPSGLVFASGSILTTGDAALSAYDPVSGRSAGVYQLPDELHTAPDRAQFDAALTRLAYANDCKVHVAVLSGTSYEPTAEWSPAQAYGKDQQCYRDPVFVDGRIRVRMGPSKSPDSYHVMSLDPDNPATPPVDQGPGRPYEEQQYTDAGGSDFDARVYLRDGSVSNVWIIGYLPLKKGQYLGDSFEYNCRVHVDDTTLLCTSGNGKAQPYGSVAVATVNTSTRKIGLRKVLPDTEAGGTAVFLSPDKKQISVHDNSGWYVAPADGSSLPQRSALSEQKLEGEPLFWS
ncbi:hypothetical protein BJY16_005021 [Actinoplanes octamycinicus]|uniref:Uncharacterized protein n=1 Tax=Actinoplanes octamycinicus TaxID=135948 RepID=A0A7W7H0L2_9ACTN|nr:hypothetical protein [Actinoplanes octamycinicus]MBB4741562.1 hypothetical protein [Actinoplanes octamycinicus]